jgi:superfamily I DNA/RNA helicase
MTHNYFDFSDLVNHVLSQIRWNGYRGSPIHFMMCDEVQDLPPNILLLLLNVTEQNLFFSGDTAQTIAQGVGFRFADLKHLFFKTTFKAPLIKQLTVNFRSHARILDLANSVIRIIELLFPNSIDKLKKEKSMLDGLTPIMLGSSMIESLFNLLSVAPSSAQKGRSGEEGESLLSKPPLEFGCDQVIIVRNQNAKEKLPGFLKHALCLTIYEAKGLEFDDVILFNFFTDSEAPEQWKLLDHLVVADVKVPIAKEGSWC